MSDRYKQQSPRWWRREPVRNLRRWVEPYMEPARVIRAILETPAFFLDYRRYKRLCADAKVGPPKLRDLHPVFGQRGQHEFDAHYVYLNAWAARKIIQHSPAEHVDVGSQVAFTTLLSATVPVRVVEFRPVPVHLDKISFVEGSILNLPFPNDSLASISSLHVIEHIGLGRYGDPLDAAGTIKAAAELSRVVAPGGILIVGLPMGRARICFNGQRIHDSRQVRSMFSGLQVVEFSGVDDNGRFHEHLPAEALDDCSYGCGFFLFRK